MSNAPTIDPLLVDIYEPDLLHPDWAKLVAAGYPWVGGTIKISQGLTYTPREWIRINWPALGPTGPAGARYGKTWLRGGYHYWSKDTSGLKQAQLYLSLIEEAGGWDVGDLWPIVDAESANNTGATKTQVEDGISEWAAEVFKETGRRPMLYGGTLMYDLGIVSNMGCDKLWFPRYTATLPPSTYERIGWELKTAPPVVQPPTVWGWQYDGDGESYLAGYPEVSPIGSVDITAIIVNGGGQAGLDWTLSQLFAENPRDDHG